MYWSFHFFFRHWIHDSNSIVLKATEENMKFLAFTPLKIMQYIEKESNMYCSTCKVNALRNCFHQVRTTNIGILMSLIYPSLLLYEIVDQTGWTGLKSSDIEAKFGLYKLHHKTTLTRQVLSAITSWAILIIYVCRKNFDCSRNHQVNRRPISISALQLPETTASS